MPVGVAAPGSLTAHEMAMAALESPLNLGHPLLRRIHYHRAVGCVTVSAQ
jgi:hypothetical protein